MKNVVFEKFLDINHQIIRGRSDKTKEKLDSIVFVLKDIKDVKIPFHIKFIKMHSFSECKKLKKIEFPKIQNFIVLKQMLLMIVQLNALIFQLALKTFKKVGVPKLIN